MIILDTNVVSEITQPRPEPRVSAWMSAQRGRDLWLTAVNVVELRLGLVIMDPGRRRDELTKATETVLHGLRRNILPFDVHAANAYVEIASARRALGRPIMEFDCQIAAIARSLGAAVATRNVRDFEHCGIRVINPWEA